MNILQNCFIEILEQNGLTVFYLDNYIPGINIYYFDGSGSITLTLTDSCMSIKSALEHLTDFGVENPAAILSQIGEDCECP